MRKLTLDRLQVESFETTADRPDERGTVQAAQLVDTNDPKYCGSWDGCPTPVLDCTYGCTEVMETCWGPCTEP